MVEKDTFLEMQIKWVDDKRHSLQKINPFFRLFANIRLYLVRHA